MRHLFPREGSRNPLNSYAFKERDLCAVLREKQKKMRVGARMFTVAYHRITWSHNIQVTMQRELTDEEFERVIDAFTPYVTLRSTSAHFDEGGHQSCLIVTRVPTRDEVIQNKKKRKAAAIECRQKVEGHIDDYKRQVTKFAKPTLGAPFFKTCELYLETDESGDKAIFWRDIPNGPNGARRRFFKDYFIVDDEIIHLELTNKNKIIPRQHIDACTLDLLSSTGTEVQVQVHLIREEKEDPLEYHNFEEAHTFCISAMQVKSFKDL